MLAEIEYRRRRCFPQKRSARTFSSPAQRNLRRNDVVTWDERHDRNTELGPIRFRFSGIIVLIRVRRRASVSYRFYKRPNEPLMRSRC